MTTKPWVWRERREILTVQRADWTDIRWKPVAIALLMFPLAIVFYQWGDVFDWRVRTGIVISVLQWILLVQGLQGRDGAPRK
jgi:hypothetical protein